MRKEREKSIKRVIKKSIGSAIMIIFRVLKSNPLGLV